MSDRPCPDGLASAHFAAAKRGNCSMLAGSPSRAQQSHAHRHHHACCSAPASGCHTPLASPQRRRSTSARTTPPRRRCRPCCVSAPLFTPGRSLQALDELRKALADAQEDRDVARKELQSARSELGDLEKGLAARAQEMRELTDDIKFDLVGAARGAAHSWVLACGHDGRCCVSCALARPSSEPRLAPPRVACLPGGAWGPAWANLAGHGAARLERLHRLAHPSPLPPPVPGRRTSTAASSRPPTRSRSSRPLPSVRPCAAAPACRGLASCQQALLRADCKVVLLGRRGCRLCGRPCSR